jgi:hypothetical protein
MVQRAEATGDTAPAKTRKKKSKKPEPTQIQPRTWASKAARGVLALAGLGLVMVVGAVLGRATARA